MSYQITVKFQGKNKLAHDYSPMCSFFISYLVDPVERAGQLAAHMETMQLHGLNVVYVYGHLDTCKLVSKLAKMMVDEYQSNEIGYDEACMDNLTDDEKYQMYEHDTGVWNPVWDDEDDIPF